MPLGADLVEIKKKRKKQPGGEQEQQVASTPKPQGQAKKQEQAKEQPQQKRSVLHDLPVPSYSESFKLTRSSATQDARLQEPGKFNITRWFESRNSRAFPARGVSNPANLCYAASIMQALIHCPPIAHFCATVASPLVPKEVKQELAPTAAMLGGWMTHYWKGMRASATASGSGNGRTTTTPMAAPKLGSLKALKVEGTAVDGHRQQDAHELVVALLDALQQEAASLSWDGQDPVGRNETDTQTGNDAADEASGEEVKPSQRGQDKGWTLVGRGKKEKMSVRTHADPNSGGEDSAEGPGGFLRRMVTGSTSQHFKGVKGTKKGHTSVVVEPFLSVLTLDIGMKPKQTLEEALTYLSVKEVIESGTEGGSEIRKVTFLASLPDVLVIMLQRYVWTREGERVKLDNLVEFGSTLTIPSDVVDPTLGRHSLGKASNRTYGLQSVVCHRGESPNSGHYVCYTPDAPVTKLPQGGAKQKQEGTFTVFNDSRVASANWKQVLSDTPYLLWFQRLS